MFERIGSIRYPAEAAEAEAMFEAALEAGAEDVDSSEHGHEIVCTPDNLAAVRDALEETFGAPEHAHLDWRAQTLTPVTDGDTARTLIKFIDALEDNDDVQRVSTNADIPDALAETL